jgi:hypothetical protein
VRRLQVLRIKFGLYFKSLHGAKVVAGKHYLTRSSTNRIKKNFRRLPAILGFQICTQEKQNFLLKNVYAREKIT